MMKYDEEKCDCGMRGVTNARHHSSCSAVPIINGRHLPECTCTICSHKEHKLPEDVRKKWAEAHEKKKR